MQKHSAKQNSNFLRPYLVRGMHSGLYISLWIVGCARATTFTVNTTTDPVSPVSVGCDVTECTLREAITAANNNSGADNIHFNVGGSGVRVFARTSNYPALTGPTVIDGYTQPGASTNTQAVGSDANILIRITGGSTAFTQSRGFVVSGGNSTIRGVSISVTDGIIPGLGVEFTDTIGNTNNVVEGVWIGVNADGTAVQNNATSITASSAINTSGLRIGGPSPQQRNVLQGGQFAGLPVPAMIIASNNAVIINNYFDLDKTGTLDLAGANVTGSLVLSNGTRFGGPTAAERNVLVNGVSLGGDGGTAVVVEGNYFGVRADGVTPYISPSQHVTVSGGSAHVIRNNVIASGDGSQAGIVFGTVVTTNAQILGNLIGTAADGTTARGLSVGIVLGSGSTSTIIGGVGDTDGNVIANSLGNGIEINGANGTQIIGNNIGLNALALPAGNVGSGIRVTGGSNQIGSAVPGGANEISRNGANGIAIVSGDANRIVGNRIHQNLGLEIDLGNGSITNGSDVNDNLDVDSGGNTRLNHPTIVSATRSANQITATLNFSTAANLNNLSVEFFRSPSCDNIGGLGQAKLSVFTANSLSSNGAGVVSSSLPFNDLNLTPAFYSAILRDAIGNSSEISPCVAVPAGLLFLDGLE